jgi:multidrug efflux pump subunit AcrB
MDLLKIGFTSALSPCAARSGEWTIRPRLLAAPGVARANVFGGEQRRIEVRADPARLLARGLTFADLAGAVSAPSTSTAAALPIRPTSAS